MAHVRILAFAVRDVPIIAVPSCRGMRAGETWTCPGQAHFSPAVFDFLMAESAGMGLEDTGMTSRDTLTVGSTWKSLFESIPSFPYV